MIRTRMLFTALILLAGPWAGEAAAHAFLERAEPAVGGSVAASPREIRLFFSEPVVPQFSDAELTDAQSAPIATGKLSQGGADKKSLVLSIGHRLPPGAYTVTWHAVSVDTHRSQGSFSFSVGR